MTLQDYYNTGDNSADGARIHGTTIQCMIITTTSAYTVTSLKLKMMRLGNPGTMTYKLYAVADNEPSGAVLASGSIDTDTFFGGDSLLENFVWEELVFDTPYAVSDATQYIIVCEAVAGDVQYNYVYWANATPSGSYTGGNRVYSTDGGSNWVQSTRDMMFETYSPASYADVSGTITTTSSLTGSVTVTTIVDVSGTIEITSSITGSVTYATIVDTSGTITVTSSLTGATIVSSNWQTDNFKTIKRLIVAGNDSIYYGDI